MLSELDYLSIGVTLVVVATYLFIIVSSLRVRSALSAGLYRTHALGMAILASAFALSQVSNYVPEDGVWGLLGSGLFALLAFGLLYWVDSSILAARTSDPLYRDTFHWTWLRQVIWGVSIACFSFVIVLNLFFIFGPQYPTVEPPLWLNLLFVVGFFFPIYSAAVSAVLVMPVAARRSKDLVFRKHLEWFFAFIAIQLVLSGIVGQAIQGPLGSSNSLATLIDGAGLLLGLYPIYQSVKRLVPLYRFSADAGEPPRELSVPNPQ